MHHYFPESGQKTASLQWIIHPFYVPDESIYDDDDDDICKRRVEALKIELWKFLLDFIKNWLTNFVEESLAVLVIILKSISLW